MGAWMQWQRNWSRRAGRVLLALVVVAAAPALAEGGGHADAAAALPAAEAEPAAPTPEGVRSSLASLEEELEEIQVALDAGSSNWTLPHALGVLQSLKTVYVQQLSALDRAVNLEWALADADAELAAAADPGALSFLALEKLRDELAVDKVREDTLSTAVALARDQLLASKEQLKNAERNRRSARDRLAVSKEPAVEAQNRLAVAAAQRVSRTAEEQERLARLERANAKQEHAIHGRRMQAKEARIAGTPVVFSKAELAKRLRLLDEERERLGLRRHEAQRRLDEALARTMPGAVQTRSTTREGALDLQQRARKLDFELISKQQQRLGRFGEVWRKRFELVQGEVPAEQIAEWAAQTAASLGRLVQAQQLLSKQLIEHRTNLAIAPRGSGAQLAGATPDAQWRAQRRQGVTELIDVLDADLKGVLEQRRLEEKLLEELSQAGAPTSLVDRLSVLQRWASAAWQFEIAEVDDRSITVGKTVTAIFIFFLGFWIARLFGRLIGRGLLPRLGVDLGNAAAVETGLVYLLGIFLALFALQFANVPLTVFTVLGGATAIAVAFGAQNLVNNFISSWILMAGRSVQVGDLIEVDHHHGHVKSIGPRSTLLRRDDGIDMLVPNSHLVEHALVNWTLTDEVIRTQVEVGVAYGSDPDRVQELMGSVAHEVKEVLPSPEPIVIFDDFGENALTFTVFFWTHAESEMEVKKTASQVRFGIARRFKEAGVVVAFPQRDIHLDASRPIPVQVVNGELDPASKGES